MTIQDWGREMTGVEHIPPNDDPGLGEAFRRGGSRMVADGGRRRGGPDDESLEQTIEDPVSSLEDREPTMREISHTPPAGEGTNGVFQRGHRASDPEHDPVTPDSDGDDLVESTERNDGDAV